MTLVANGRSLTPARPSSFSVCNENPYRSDGSIAPLPTSPTERTAAIG